MKACSLQKKRWVEGGSSGLALSVMVKDAGWKLLKGEAFLQKYVNRSLGALSVEGAARVAQAAEVLRL